MDDFSKTGSRNMAETCAINFLTLISYSTSIVIGGLRSNVSWCGLFGQKRRVEVFEVFLQI